jgi:hypothetical protein
MMSTVSVASVVSDGDASAAFQVWNFNLTRAGMGSYSESSSIMYMFLSLWKTLRCRALLFLLLFKRRVAKLSWSDEV